VAVVSTPIKLSAPATKEFWEIPVLFEDEHLLALNKPVGLLLSPDLAAPDQPSLMQLLHAGIAAGKPWAKERGLTYLSQAHRLDRETSGILLLAKSKPVLIALADLFGSEKTVQKQLALVHGTPLEDKFEVEAKIASHPVKPGLMHVDSMRGKKSKTRFEAIEKFTNCTLLHCFPVPGRTHQARVHLRQAGWPIVGDELYGGKNLWLSRLKPNYRLKPGHEERPLISTAALHAEELSLPHPVTGLALTITAPWPKYLTVAVKYLRLYAK
jgi:RluA family pseudouridine synthase